MNDELKIKNNELGGKMNYRYRTDEEMKDSGIEWIGTIPKAWNLSKFKFISELYTGNSIKDNEKDNYQDSNEAYPYIATKDIDMNYNKADYFNGMYTKINDINFRIAKKNSILLCIEGGSAGKKITYLNKNVSFVNKLCCINSSNINNKYQYYYCNSNSFLKEFKLNISGLIGGVSVGVLKNFIITKPNIVEQEKIAKFLDKKTAQFDSIISKKEALIEKLEEAKKSLISEVVTGKVRVVKTDDGYELVERKKEEMKDSGVEWIGDIPKNYKTIRLGLISFVTKLAGFEYTNNMASAISRLGEVPIVRAGNIKMNKFIDQDKEFIDIDTSKLLNRCALYQKCVLITFIGAGIGEVALFNKSKRYHLAPNVAKIEILRENKQKIDEQFLVYYLMSSAGQEEVNKIKKASAQPSLSMETIRSIKVVLPEWDEQEEITEYLGLKIEEMDKAKNKILEQIKKLKEGKQSLISEAVTGKIEIL